MIIAMSVAAVIIILGGVIIFFMTREQTYDRLEEITVPAASRNRFYARETVITQAEIDRVAVAWKYTNKTTGEPVYPVPPPEPSMYNVPSLEQYGNVFSNFTGLFFNGITGGMSAIGVVCILYGIKSYGMDLFLTGIGFLAAVLIMRLNETLLLLYRAGILPDYDSHPEIPLKIYLYLLVVFISCMNFA